MKVRDVLEKIIYRTSTVSILDDLAPIIERALDELIDAMTAGDICAMPQNVRDRWHGVFVAAMVEKK